jgi:hypothetical protein
LTGDPVWLMGDPAKLTLSPGVLEMLRRCYDEELTTFREKNQIPQALFTIIRARFIGAGLLVQQREVYVNKQGAVVPMAHQVSTITKLVRKLCSEGKL